MVAPPKALITVGIADMRAEPDDGSELVDQAHLTEIVTVLGERNDWRFVQGQDHYFGWVRLDQMFEVPGSNNAGIVAVLLADVHERESGDSPVIERLPAGTRPPQNWRAMGRDGTNKRPEWAEVPLRGNRTHGPRSGFLAVADTTRDGDHNHSSFHSTSPSDVSNLPIGAFRNSPPPAATIRNGRTRSICRNEAFPRSIVRYRRVAIRNR